MLLGLLSSTFSTLVSQVTAARIGRDAVVDRMVVAAIPLRDGALQMDPSGPVILAGILFHQAAGFSWAVVFFGLLGRWTGRLNPWMILLIAPVWALFTSATEWLVLVPAAAVPAADLLPGATLLNRLARPRHLGLALPALPMPAGCRRAAAPVAPSPLRGRLERRRAAGRGHARGAGPLRLAGPGGRLDGA
ncbi:hypothetical protein [Methylobacterium sp. P1-11]|uniref:hypothetical protein n=1 Tax=Methylobacterium sp. P1-11 TaxID=2024616 RepID=UPI001FED81E6|nr:hypothetical protein [Methylobacterium sp. P1-11]